MRGLPIAVAALLCLVALAHAGEPVGFQVNEIDPQSWALVVTGNADDLELDAITVNRGNCTPQVPVHMPQQLGNGERRIWGYFFCNPIEIVAQTNRGMTTVTEDDRVRAGVSAERELITPGYWQIAVTAHESSISISDFEINEGACKGTVLKSYDHAVEHQAQLLFGQRFLLGVGCLPTDVTIKTDLGSGNFSW
jgi:hypothetical protein